MIFTKDMTYPEALMLLYTEVDGKTEEERKQLLEDFKSISRAITKKESEDDDGYLTSYAI